MSILGIFLFNTHILIERNKMTDVLLRWAG